MTRRGVLLASGLVQLVGLSVAASIDARAQSGTLLLVLAGVSLAYVAALMAVARGGGSRSLLLVCLSVAVIGRGALIGSAPLVSDDVYRYVWDGRVQRLGLNPYHTVPDDPELADVHTEVTRRIHPVSAALPTIYPPAAQVFFRIVTAAHESVAALVVAIVLCDLLTIVVVWRWLLLTGRDPWWVLAYAWHPLVALEGAGGGHIDVVGTLLVATAAYTLTARRTRLATIAVALAVVVKFLPVVLLPLLWRRVRVTDAIIGAGVVVALYLPFVGGGGLPVGSLGTYVEGWRFNGPFFSMLEPWLGVRGVLAVAMTSGLATATVVRQRLGRDDPRAWAWPLAATLVLLPAVYPWYLLWVTPFLMVRGTWPLTTWTVASLATYAVWANEIGGHGWVIPGWVEPVEYGLVIVTAWWVSRGPESSPGHKTPV